MRQLLYLFVLGFLAACSSPRAEDASVPAFRSMIHPPLADSLKDVGGSMLSLTAGYEIGIEQLQTPSQHYLVLDSLIKRDDAGRPLWKVLDAIRVSVPDSFFVVIGTCGRGQPWAADSSVVAIARAANAEFREDLAAAWRVDLSRHRFVAESLTGLKCLNEGFEP